MTLNGAGQGGTGRRKYLEVKDTGLNLLPCTEPFFVPGEYFCGTVHAGDSVECLSHFLVMRPITISVLHSACVCLALSVFVSFFSLSIALTHSHNRTAKPGNLFILVDWTVSGCRLGLTPLFSLSSERTHLCTHLFPATHARSFCSTP